MSTYLIEELARQRHAELLAKASGPRPESPRTNPGPTLRNNVGWAIVAVGLRIVAG